MAGLLAFAVLALLLLLRQERRAPSPLLPVQLLKQSAVWRTDALAGASGAAIVALITFLPIYLSVVRGVAPGEIGLRVLPLTALPDPGQTWIGWGGACPGTAVSCTVVTNSNLSVTANFR